MIQLRLLKAKIGEIWGQFHQHVNSNLLLAKIPKVQKSSHWCVFALLGSAHAKAARKNLVKLTQGVNSSTFCANIFAPKGHKAKL